MTHTLVGLILCAGVMFPQVTVTLKPIRLVTVKKSLNLGKAAGLWTVTPCSDAAVKLTLDRGRIEQAAPELPILPNDLAEDVLGRRAAAAPESIIGDNADSVLGIATTALGIGGFATGSRDAEIAAVSLAGIRLLFQATAKARPDPRPLVSHLLPDAVVLPAFGCAPTSYVIASQISAARPIQRQILIRGQ